MLKNLYLFYTIKHAHTRLPFISIYWESLLTSNLAKLGWQRRKIFVDGRVNSLTNPDNHNEKSLFTFYVDEYVVH